MLTVFGMMTRHEWYQNDSYVTISVFIKNAKKELVDINITEKAVRNLLRLVVQQRRSGRRYVQQFNTRSPPVCFL